MSRYLIVYIFFAFSLFADKPIITIIEGTCSSGKSSLSKEFCKQNDNWTYVDEDEVFLNEWLKEVEHRYPNKYKTLSKVFSSRNILAAVVKDIIFFKEDALAKDCNKSLTVVKEIRNTLTGNSQKKFSNLLIARMQEQTITQIKQQLKDKKHIILDRWYISSEKLTEVFPECNIIKALAFCSLDSSMDKLNNRNKESIINGDGYNSRYYGQLFCSFSDLYNTTTKKDKSISSTKKSELETLFNKVKQKVLTNRYNVKTFPSPGNSCAERLDTLKGKLIDKGISKDATIHISPKNDYSIIINTDKNSPKEAAKLLLKSIKKN